MTNVAFIGFGKLGKPCAEVIAQKGHDVSVYDPREVESEYCNIKDTIEEAVKDRVFVFVAVPTPHDLYMMVQNPHTIYPLKILITIL